MEKSSEMAISGKQSKDKLFQLPLRKLYSFSRSLRICLNLFSYYAPQIKEKHIKWYAVRLLQCMSTMAQRKETLLQETLCDFVKQFGRYVQQGLNDSETCKLFEVKRIAIVAIIYVNLHRFGHESILM